MDSTKAPGGSGATAGGARGGARAPRRLAIGLATLGGNLFLAAGSLILGTIAILLSWIPPRGRIFFTLARVWSRGLLLASGVRVEAAGAPAAEERRCIYMCNHLSMYDIPALLVTLPDEARFLAKKSLFQIPVFGWALRRGGFITIDREDRRRAGESFRAAIGGLREGASLLVFPEGSRSLDGELQPFERGGFLLALKSGMPIVPVGIWGSLAVQRRGALSVRPGRIQVRYGSAIDVEGHSVRRREVLEAEVRDRIVELVGAARHAIEGGDPRPRVHLDAR